MPAWWPYRRSYPKLREKVYRGYYGDTARRKIATSQRRKGVRAVFPDCPGGYW